MRRLVLLLAGLVAACALGAGVAAAQSPQRALRLSLSRTFRHAGAASGAMAIDTTTGRVLYAARPATRRIPASVEKMYTTSTALLRFGPRGTLPTRVLGTGSFTPLDGTWHGDLYLRGGGDPTFGKARFAASAYGTGASVEQIARQLVRADGIRRVTGRIVGDESRFDTRRGTVYSGYATSLDIGGPLSALSFDRGLARDDGSALQTRPAVFSAARLAGAMRALGASVSTTRIASGRTPARGTQQLAEVDSPPLATLIRLTNQPSDNYFAEMLLKDLGAYFGGKGSSAAGATVVRAQAARVGLHPAVVDGSGLSRYDSSSPAQIAGLLRSLRANRPFTSSLAVAGRVGTLADRMRGTSAAGRCRGKTGTLSNVSNLAGYCRSRRGHLIVFAWLMNRISPSYAHGLQDRMTVALARYPG